MVSNLDNHQFMATSLDSGQDTGSFPSVAACEVTRYVLGSLEETEANNESKTWSLGSDRQRRSITVTLDHAVSVTSCCVGMRSTSGMRDWMLAKIFPWRRKCPEYEKLP